MEILQETKDYLELIRIREAMLAAFQGMVNELANSNDGAQMSAETMMHIIDVYGRALDTCMPAAFTKLAMMYQERFTPDEIKRLDEIQRDPTFQKLTQNHPAIEAEFNGFVAHSIQEEVFRIQEREHQQRIEAEEVERQRNLTLEQENSQ